jgi:hypothetical protein
MLPSGDLGCTLANAEEAKSRVTKIVHLNVTAIFRMRKKQIREMNLGC